MTASARPHAPTVVERQKHLTVLYPVVSLCHGEHPWVLCNFNLSDVRGSHAHCETEQTFALLIVFKLSSTPDKPVHFCFFIIHFMYLSVCISHCVYLFVFVFSFNEGHLLQKKGWALCFRQVVIPPKKRLMKSFHAWLYAFVPWIVYKCVICSGRFSVEVFFKNNVYFCMFQIHNIHLKEYTPHSGLAFTQRQPLHLVCVTSWRHSIILDSGTLLTKTRLSQKMSVLYSTVRVSLSCSDCTVILAEVYLLHITQHQIVFDAITLPASGVTCAKQRKYVGPLFLLLLNMIPNKK